jgi:hypothetical protein
MICTDLEIRREGASAPWRRAASGRQAQAARSAVNDVQRPFFDVERSFSDGFA